MQTRHVEQRSKLWQCDGSSNARASCGRAASCWSWAKGGRDASKGKPEINLPRKVAQRTSRE